MYRTIVACWIAVLLGAIANSWHDHAVVAQYGYESNPVWWAHRYFWGHAGVAAAVVVLLLVAVLRGGALGLVLVPASIVVGALAAFGIFILANCGACGGSTLDYVFPFTLAAGAIAIYSFVVGVALIRRAIQATNDEAV